MAELKLYNYFRSSTSYRVRIALALKELKYEYIPIHLLNNGGEQNQATYRQINPQGGVPSLSVDGKIISQSMAIIEYLDEAFATGHKLFPTDLFLKAKVRQVCENINADIHPLPNLRVQQYLQKILGLTEDQKAAWTQKWIHDGFIAIEKILETTHGKYCFGNQVTAADVLLIPQMFTAERFQIDLKKYPILYKIYENCMQLEAFKKSHPYCQVDTPAELKN